jgi:hypothetical protein
MGQYNSLAANDISRGNSTVGGLYHSWGSCILGKVQELKYRTSRWKCIMLLSFRRFINTNQKPGREFQISRSTSAVMTSLRQERHWCNTCVTFVLTTAFLISATYTPVFMQTRSLFHLYNYDSTNIVTLFRFPDRINSMKIFIFWDITPCSSLCFGGTWRLHL